MTGIVDAVMAKGGGVKRLGSLLMLLAVGSALSGPLLASASGHAEEAPAAAHHADGAPCPDGDGNGPCDEGCPCLCCPGHASALHVASDISVPAASPMTPDRVGPPDTVRPDGVSSRVFRPPRG
jgi:hypothetical protein